MFYVAARLLRSILPVTPLASFSALVIGAGLVVILFNPQLVSADPCEGKGPGDLKEGARYNAAVFQQDSNSLGLARIKSENHCRLRP